MVFIVVVDAVAVGAEDDAAFFDFFVGGGVAFVLNQLVYALFVWVVPVYVVKIEYGGV